VSSNPVIVALDTAELDQLAAMAAGIGPHVGMLKVGLQAYVANGPAAVRAASAHAPVFLDLKLHDIPSTVAGAAAAAEELPGVHLLTVHAAGGTDMIAAAATAAPSVRILAVTVLTSLDDAALERVGQPPAADQVPRLAVVAVEAGAAGVVCAPTDVAAVRAVLGDEPLVVTPGVRPAGAAVGDQARVATPPEALAAGADYVVVGRPVTGAEDPARAAAALAAELAA
jgi:orotidine-5'-phosphate decarboxylase